MVDEEETQDETENEEGEAQEADDKQAEQDSVLDTKARDMGWTPKDDFKGDPANWRTAEDFVKRGEEFLPFIKKDRDKAQAEVKALKADVAKNAANFKKLEKMNQVALDNQRDQLTAQFSAQKRSAVEMGDTEAFDKIEKAENEALVKLDKKTQPDAAKPIDELPPAVRTTVDAWITDNRWFESDDEMRALAAAHHGKLQNDKPGLTLAENLDETREYVKKRFPEKFSVSTKPSRGSPVEGGARTGGKSNGLWGKLPKDAKAQATRMIKDGQFIRPGESAEKDIAKAQQRYAESYFEGEEA